MHSNGLGGHGSATLANRSAFAPLGGVDGFAGRVMWQRVLLDHGLRCEAYDKETVDPSQDACTKREQNI